MSILNCVWDRLILKKYIIFLIYLKNRKLLWI